MNDSKEEGPADFWSQMMGSKSFHEKIGLYKYARWAQGLTERQFLALLCAVGEYGYRADKALAILRRHAPKDDVSVARAMVGLEIIGEFAGGSPGTEEEGTRRVREAVARAQAELGAPPNGSQAEPPGNSGAGNWPPPVS